MNGTSASVEQMKRAMFSPPFPNVPSTIDMRTQNVTLPVIETESGNKEKDEERKGSLDHVLTNIMLLQDFVLENGETPFNLANA